MEKNINVWGFHNPIEHEEKLIKIYLTKEVK